MHLGRIHHKLSLLGPRRSIQLPFQWLVLLHRSAPRRPNHESQFPKYHPNPSKIHQKTVQTHTKTHQIINRKKYIIFQRVVHWFNNFFIDFSKQFLIKFPNLEKIPHLTICSKIFECIEGRGSRFSLKIAIQIYWKSIQKAIQIFNDFSMILEGFRASFWEAKRGQGRPWKQDQKRHEKEKVQLRLGIFKTRLVGFAPQ